MGLLMILLKLMKEEGGASPLMSFNYDIITGNIINQYTFGILFNTFKNTSTNILCPAESELHDWKTVCFCAFLYVSVWQSGQYIARAL